MQGGAKGAKLESGRCEAQRVRLAAGLIATIALIAIAIAAQSPPRGKMTGTVVDTSDALMPGLSVTLHGPGCHSTVSDKDGAFACSDLLLGDYELRASLDGFSTIVQKVTATDGAAEDPNCAVEARPRRKSSLRLAR